MYMWAEGSFILILGSVWFHFINVWNMAVVMKYPGFMEMEPWKRSLLLRLVMSNWRLVAVQTSNQALLTENERLQMINPKESIWQMRKAELIELAIAELQVTRAAATKMTVEELRERLRLERKKAKDEEDPLQRLPKGLSKMTAAQLRAECTQRLISVAPLPDEKRLTKTRPQMMLEIRHDVDRRQTPDAEQDWMSVEDATTAAASEEPAGSQVLVRRTRAREGP